MSIRSECLAAAYRLLDQPYLRPITEGPEGLFTELDVIILAAREATEGMTDDQRAEWMDKAQLEASNALGGLFRAKDVVRYGPVQFPGSPKLDYMRIDTKMAYSSLHGPELVDTPNGVFGRIFADNDPAKGRGRRWGANRTDLLPWDAQDIVTEEPKEDPADELASLRSLVAYQRQQLRIKDREIAQLKKFRDAMVS